MPVGERKRFLAAYARERAGDGLGAELVELVGHGTFAAELSVFLARVAGNREHIASLLSHEDCDVAATAVKAAAALGGLDDALERAVLEGALHLRLAAYRALRAWRREDLADRLLPQVRERFGEREAARLLTACGKAACAAALPELAYAFTAWSTLARRRPLLFAEYAEQSLAGLPHSQWAQWWSHHRGGVTAAVEAAPGPWLPLFERFWVEDLSPVVAESLPRLARADAEATWRFVLDPARASLIRASYYHRRVLRRLAEQDTATIAAFLLAGPGRDHAQARLLPMLAPSRREAVLTACGDEPRSPLLRRHAALLPKRLRRRAAREQLSHRKVADDRALREDLRSLLPFREVHRELLAATGRSSTLERSAAYERLIRCAGLDGPKAVTTMLGATDRLAREQDPVHVAALGALAKVPAHRWQEAHLPRLGELIDAVLGSPWRSSQTNHGLLRLASRMLLLGMSHRRPAFTEFGYGQLERVAAESGSRDIAAAVRPLPTGAVVELCRRLAPVMAGQAEVGRFKLPLVFAEALGRRAGEVPELLALLREASRSADADAARRAASRLVAADGKAAAELVEADPAMAAVPPVFALLTRERVDALARWLAAPGEGTAMLLRPLSRSITRRWPPAVREAYLDALASLARDGRRSGRERAMAVRAMSRVAGLRVEDLEGLPVDADRALAASVIAATDAARPFERAWDLLMEHAAGPKAPVAGIGLARLARRMRPDFLGERVASMLDAGKLATRKQGVRLMLEYRLPQAEEAVERMWGEEALPEGVREAIVAGLVGHLDRPWARRIVADSPRFGADVAAPALAPAPLAVAPRHRSGYAELLAHAADSGDERLMEAALLVAGRWAPYAVKVRDALVDLASDLDATAHWSAGLGALCDLAVGGGDWDPLLEAVRRLRSGERVEPNATAERDSPVRQRLERLVSLLTSALHRGAVEGVPALLVDRLPVDLGTRLLFATVPWEADSTTLRRLASRIGDPVEAFELARELEQRLYADRLPGLLPFFERLASSGVPNACVLAAAAIRMPGSRAGWTPEWRELLRRLRDYPASEVSRLACGVYTSAE